MVRLRPRDWHRHTTGCCWCPFTAALALMKFKLDDVGSVVVVGVAFELGCASVLPLLARQACPSTLAQKSA